MIKIGEADLPWPGEMVRVGDTLLVGMGGRVCAYRDRCPHQRVALSEGRLDGAVLTCRAHGWSFDVESGQGLNPADARLEAVEVEVRDDGVYVGRAP